MYKRQPFVFLLLYAALQSVPQSQYEAARIDGANRFKILFYVTLPNIKNSLALCALLRTIDSFRLFDKVNLLTGGGPANTTYGENTGVLALSKVYDPRVIRLAAVYAIILSFSPKFDALVNSIPSAIVGGVSFILYGMISAVGVRNIVENQVDLTKSRNLIIAAVMFCLLYTSDAADD